MSSTGDDSLARYARQILVQQLGESGQRALMRGRAAVIGCGALGGTIASLLVRAGVGLVRLVDRDVVETHNLHRQLLYDEADAAALLPKAEAARARLARANSAVVVEARVEDVGPHNVRSLLAGVDLVMDGTDNAQARYLLNDACLELGLPWIYGGAVATTGMSLTVVPGQTACLRCLFPEPPPSGLLPTGETVGVLGTVPALVASLQATEALKLLGRSSEPSRDLVALDAWQGELTRVRITRDPRCPACGEGRRDFLAAVSGGRGVRPCGGDAVQVGPPEPPGPGLEAMVRRLAELSPVQSNEHLAAARVDGHHVLVFADGRTLVRGTTEPATALRVYECCVEASQPG